RASAQSCWRSVRGDRVLVASQSRAPRNGRSTTSRIQRSRAQREPGEARMEVTAQASTIRTATASQCRTVAVIAFGALRGRGPRARNEPPGSGHARGRRKDDRAANAERGGSPFAAPAPFGSSCRHARPWWIRGVAGSVPGGELAGRDVELRAPVPRPGALVAGGVQRPGLAEALRLEARLVEAEAHEELLGRVRPAEAQRDVVLDRAALVRVP